MSRVSGVVLGLLVAASLVLATQLWTPQQAPLPSAATPPVYPIADTIRGLSAADVVQPWRLVAHFGAVRAAAVADPGNPDFTALWADVRAALAVTPVGPQRATAGAARECATAAATVPLAVEVDLGQSFRWSEWMHLLNVHGQSTAAANPTVDRLLIEPMATGADICRFAGTGAARYHADRAPAFAALGRDLSALKTRPLDYELVPLVQAPAGLRVRPGIDVPKADFQMWTVRVRSEFVGPADMRAALFPPAATVRRTAGSDGAAFFSDGVSQLEVAPDGSVRYTAGTPLAADPESPAHALGVAVRFVDRAGGWPPTGLLLGLSARPQPGSFRLHGGETGTSGYRLAFTERWHGMPLLSQPAPIEVDVGAAGIADYARHVQVPVAAGSPVTLLPAAQVLARLAASWPLAAAASPHTVIDMLPAYAEAANGGRWQPVWAVELGDGSIVTLSARQGRIIGVIRPAAAS